MIFRINLELICSCFETKEIEKLSVIVKVNFLFK